MALVREFALVIAGFAVLTIVLTYPQILAMGTKVGTHYDALFSIWRLAWIAHAVRADPRHLLDANIFWPERGTLAYSDAILLPGVMGAPLIRLGVHPVVVYNLLVLGSFVAASSAMYLLVRDLTRSVAGATLAGVVFAFQAYRFGHYAQLELLWSWPIPIALWAFHRIVRTRNIRYGVFLAFAIALQAWSSVYYAIFLVSALAVLAPFMLIGRPWAEQRDLMIALTVGAIICAALVGPYVFIYEHAASRVGSRSTRDVLDWSPTAIQYLATTPNNRLYGRWLGFGSVEMALFPGFTAVLAAVAGLWPPVSRTRIAYALLLVLAVDLSLGLHGLTYATVFQTVSVYRGLRVPARLFVIVSAALSVLAGYGIDRVIRACSSGVTKRAVAILVVAAALIESAPMPIDLAFVDRTYSPIYRWLSLQPPSVVMEWPMPKASSLGVTHEPQYMYASIQHWQRLVNGYSGFYPSSYIRFLAETETFPSAQSIAYLRRVGVDVIILHSDLDGARYRHLRDTLLVHRDFEFLVGDGGGAAETTVYKLLPRPRG